MTRFLIKIRYLQEKITFAEKKKTQKNGTATKRQEAEEVGEILFDLKMSGKTSKDFKVLKNKICLKEKRKKKPVMMVGKEEGEKNTKIC